MITRTMWLQLLGFALVALIGVGYVGFRYAGFENLLGSATYPVTVRMTDPGGIFTGADVTYRGVSVGRVGPLRLTADGLEMTLDIDDDAPPIPADTDIVVRHLSAIGEQFVDVVPRSDAAPYLEGGSVVPADRVRVPVPIPQLIGSVDALAASVPRESLRTVVDELGTAFDGTAQPLQQILDTTGAFTDAARDALPQTLALLDDGRTVLATQNDLAPGFRDISRDLKLLAEQLERSDPDIRRLLETGPAAGYEVSKLLRASGGDLGDLLANLLTISRVAEPRQANLRQVLATYPGVASGIPTLTPGDGTAHLGIVLEPDPPACTAGYEGTVHRPGSDVTDVPVNRKAYCAEPPGSPITVRGAQNVPGAATPMAAGSPGQGATSQLAVRGQAAAEQLGAPLGSAPPMGSPAEILAAG
ncbi:MlaD family protein [Pseudonocardia sp.]|uniref:MlaD family protein n=1 Tax=Pseudonocardia sp. TaxID=60912 RepID=UPI003D0E496E